MSSSGEPALVAAALQSEFCCEKTEKDEESSVPKTVESAQGAAEEGVTARESCCAGEPEEGAAAGSERPSEAPAEEKKEEPEKTVRKEEMKEGSTGVAKQSPSASSVEEVKEVSPRKDGFKSSDSLDKKLFDAVPADKEEKSDTPSVVAPPTSSADTTEEEVGGPTTDGVAPCIRDTVPSSSSSLKPASPAEVDASTAGGSGAVEASTSAGEAGASQQKEAPKKPSIGLNKKPVSGVSLNKKTVTPKTVSNSHEASSSGGLSLQPHTATGCCGPDSACSSTSSSAYNDTLSSQQAPPPTIFEAYDAQPDGTMVLPKRKKPTEELPPALARQYGLPTTVSRPDVLRTEMRDLPPFDPEYAEQYMVYAQQFSAYAQQFALYAQYCAQKGAIDQMKAAQAEQIAQRKAELEKARKKALKKGKPLPEDPGAPKPMMVTPYRHNWLISGKDPGDTIQEHEATESWSGMLYREASRLFGWEDESKPAEGASEKEDASEED